MTFVPPPLPSVALVRRADAVIDALGQFNLHDAELRAVRVTLAPGNVPTLEADFYLDAHRITLRCTDVADLALADFEHQNVVTGYAFEPTTPDDPDGRHVHVTLTGAPGCDLDLRCAAVEVVAVVPVPADDAI